ncbi:S41 family peptidase [Pseudoalteromonas sp. T1lg65]|uniref:S41 family peptidase n=1 Tax=Pseudoalteromonas sp. T1lg65 TaxID=2077101 RepID=UPI003F7A8906
MIFRAISMFSLCCLSYSAHANNATTQTNNWTEDINFYTEQVKSKHINPFHTLSETEFDQKVATLKQALPTLPEVEIETQLAGITASIGDGHTSYFMMSGPHKHYPLRFKFFEGKLRIIGTSDKYKALLGHELISINSVSVATLFNILSGYLPSVDNHFSQQIQFEFYVTLEKLLRGLGIVTADKPARFTTRGNIETTTTVISPVSMREFSQVNSAFERKVPKLSFQQTNMDGIELAFINGNTAYFQFSHYPSLDQVMAQCAALQSNLTANKVSKLIIDFRDNGGGNFYVGLAFSACLQPLEQVDWLNGVVVLTSGYTYSAAMSNTVQFKQILNAKIIGEPTGGDPNTFAESYRFELPNSKRSVSLSVRYYPFTEQAADAVYPDITVKPTWESYQQGKDIVLLSALRFLQHPTMHTHSETDAFTF